MQSYRICLIAGVQQWVLIGGGHSTKMSKRVRTEVRTSSGPIAECGIIQNHSLLKPSSIVIRTTIPGTVAIVER